MPPKAALSNEKQSNKRKAFQQPVNANPAKRFKSIRDNRNISTQPSDAAYKNGELDVAKFVQAREFEIRALEESMRKSRNGLNQRAFQQVPREMRRRAASHNVKKVPKRLRRRAKREMIEDNTPTNTSRKEAKSGKARLRLDTARALQRVSTRIKAKKDKQDAEQSDTREAAPATASTPVKIRVPRVKKNTLQSPWKPKSKFSKRQKDKTWLPTHMYHTKRAHMTPARSPLWRWAIPLTPTMKGYRATHRASIEKGAVAWDMSYISTIALEGREKSIEGLLRAMSIGKPGTEAEKDTWGGRGRKWRAGLRAWHGWLHERDKWPEGAVAPVSLIWRGEEAHLETEGRKPTKRKLFLRVHPSAFLQVWNEVLRLASVQKPSVTVEDLRFEIGSFELTGPQALEALVGTLHEYEAPVKQTSVEDVGEKTNKPKANSRQERSQISNWQSLANCANPANLPRSFVIQTTVLDPRLRFPPRKVALHQDQVGQEKLLQLAAQWPWDNSTFPAPIFDRLARLTASKLPSQKSIDRRKGSAPPGKFPTLGITDPPIPVLIYVTPLDSRKNNFGPALTVLAPWKSIATIWRALMYYPLSTGSQVRLGCLEQQRQVAFEAGVPWFPADFPGTAAGNAWAAMEEERQQKEWERKPKAKRVAYNSIHLGKGRKGELGRGWTADWDYLRQVHAIEYLCHVPRDIAQQALAKAMKVSTETTTQPVKGALTNVKIRLLTKGSPQPNARIYRLPKTSPAPQDSASLPSRESWLALLPITSKGAASSSTSFLRRKQLPPDAPPHLRNQELAATLLQPAPQSAASGTYPSVPGEEDLVGFVTAGNYNLAYGTGSAVGSVLLDKVLAHDGSPQMGQSLRERTLCIVRNAGETVGRLASWELV